jgi:hypothetical protein
VYCLQSLQSNESMLESRMRASEPQWAQVFLVDIVVT